MGIKGNQFEDASIDVPKFTPPAQAALTTGSGTNAGTWTELTNTYTIVGADNGKAFVVPESVGAGFTITLDAALSDGFEFRVHALTTQQIVIAPASGERFVVDPGAALQKLPVDANITSNGLPSYGHWKMYRAENTWGVATGMSGWQQEVSLTIQWEASGTADPLGSPVEITEGALTEFYLRTGTENNVDLGTYPSLSIAFSGTTINPGDGMGTVDLGTGELVDWVWDDPSALLQLTAQASAVGASFNLEATVTENGGATTQVVVDVIAGGGPPMAMDRSVELSGASSPTGAPRFLAVNSPGMIPSLGSPQPFVVTIWLKRLSAFATGGVLVGLSDTFCPAVAWRIYATGPDTLAVELTQDGDPGGMLVKRYQFSSPIPLNQWTQVGFQYVGDTDSLGLIRNGSNPPPNILQDDALAFIANAVLPLTVGSGYNVPGMAPQDTLLNTIKTKFRVDELAIWTGASTFDTNEVYNGGTPPDLTTLGMTDPPTAWYRMDGNGAVLGAVSGDIPDQQGQFPDLQSINGPIVTDDVSPGVRYSEYSMNFDFAVSTTAYALGSNDASQNPGNPSGHFSVSFWAKFQGTCDVGDVVLSRWNESDTDRQWKVDISSGGALQFTVSTDGRLVNIPLPAEQSYLQSEWMAGVGGPWRLYVAVYNADPGISGSLTLYVNDSQAQNDILIAGSGFLGGFNTSSPAPMRVGADGSGAGFPQNYIAAADNVYVDDIYLWDGELTGGDVATIYNAGRPNDASGSVALPILERWRSGDNENGVGSTVQAEVSGGLTDLSLQNSAALVPDASA